MENMMETVCPNCGEKLPGDSSFCMKCGTKIEEDGPGTEQEQPAQAPGFWQKNKKKIIIAAAAVAVVVLVFVIVNAVQASNLKKELERGWCKVEGEEGAYILCVLDFSEDEIEYRLETGYAWMDTTVATYDYKVISGNKIKVLRYGDDWETIRVELSDDKKAMIVSPALTSTDNEEIWVNID